jgi:aspartyl protease family protein
MTQIHDRELEDGQTMVILEPQKPQEYSAGKTLRFAVTVFAGCIVCGIATASLMSYVGRGLAVVNAAPARVSTAVAAAVPASKAAPARPPVANTLTYAADSSGHYFIDAAVNGVPIRFMVDTGATFVALSPEDAAAAGIASQNLSFSDAVNTANGVTHAARTSLRSVRLGQFEVDDVAAVVMDQPMPFSLLGMSFLSRVDGYSIRDGVLTIDW